MIKKLNNKGFSLVELIIVVAIMAVLVGVLAPQFLRYVEKSRLQKDNSAIGEIGQAAKIACADETINKAVKTAGGITFTTASNAFTFSASGDALTKELNKTVGPTVELKSNNYNGKTVSIIVSVSGTDGVVTVTGTGIISAPDESGTTVVF